MIDVNVSMAFSLLRGAGYAILLSSHVRYILKIVKVENITKAIVVCSISLSIFTASFNPLAGYIYENFGFNYLYFILLGIGLLGLVVFIFCKPSKESA